MTILYISAFSNSLRKYKLLFQTIKYPIITATSHFTTKTSTHNITSNTATTTTATNNNNNNNNNNSSSNSSSSSSSSSNSSSSSSSSSSTPSLIINFSKTQKSVTHRHPSFKPLFITKQKKTIKQELPNDFTELKLHPGIVLALKSLEITKPSQIQTLAIPPILRGRNVFLAAETGSGKTLAYLTPIIHILKMNEFYSNKQHLNLASPRAIVFLPTTELCTQVLKVAKTISHFVKLRIRAINRGMSGAVTKSHLSTPIDLLITTPMTFFLLQKYKKIKTENLTHIVFDEGDTLFDRSFRGILSTITNPLNLRYSPTEEGIQVTISAASVSSEIKKHILDIIPSVTIVRSQTLHHVLPHVNQRFYRVLQHNKFILFNRLLKLNSKLKTIVFCNTIESAEWLYHNIKETTPDVIMIHGDLPEESRQEFIHKFMNDTLSLLLICTDIISRGIDTTSVRHVIMFDFPSTPLDYLHRIGRTGRLHPLHVTGKLPFYRVSVLVVKRREHRLSEKLKKASREKRPLDTLALGWK